MSSSFPIFFLPLSILPTMLPMRPSTDCLLGAADDGGGGGRADSSSESLLFAFDFEAPLVAEALLVDDIGARLWRLSPPRAESAEMTSLSAVTDSPHAFFPAEPLRGGA